MTQYRRYDRLGRRQWQSSINHRLTDALTSPEQGVLWRAYHYDDLHELAAVEDSNRGMLSYGYDVEGRLRNVYSTHGDQTSVHYDQADNALILPLQTPESSPYVRGCQPYSDNRLTRWEEWQYQYDAFGNMSVRQKGPGSQHYRYDADNRLVRAKGDGPKGLFEAQYPLGRRSSKVVTLRQERRETHFLWQGLRLLQSRTDDHQQTYCYDPNEAYTPLACIERHYSGDKLYWYHTDLNGSPQEVTDAQGDMLWSGQYGVFGQVTRQTDAMWRNFSQPLGRFRQPLRYAGQYLDEETGLHYNTYRYYAPEVGRFITPDPIGLMGGLNLYAYAPNPLIWVDPLGLKCTHSASNPKQAHSAIKDKWGHPMSKRDMRELQNTVDRIKSNNPHYSNDGTTFGNTHSIGNPNSQRLDTGSGPYKEWTVKTPDLGGNGARRVVVDTKTGKAYYSHDHYDSFIEINLGGWK
ncbi:RHS repeat-associated core domain-containing protein [Serratia sp. L9]|uniref:RHS repeat-associated core domain-containing protein n=1 Tax=Serratia sp. L9 TaxID=3423946 RepID=UPI003D677EAF